MTADFDLSILVQSILSLGFEPGWSFTFPCFSSDFIHLAVVITLSVSGVLMVLSTLLHILNLSFRPAFSLFILEYSLIGFLSFYFAFFYMIFLFVFLSLFILMVRQGSTPRWSWWAGLVWGCSLTLVVFLLSYSFVFMVYGPCTMSILPPKI